jgi:hypothetical protein
VLVHEAGILDHEGGKGLLKPLKGCFPRLKLIWVDSAYKKGGFVEWVKETFGWEVEVVEHPWSGQRGVWAPKDAVIDWEQIRPQWFPRPQMALDCRANLRLALEPFVGSLRTMKCSQAVRKLGSTLP